MSSREKPRHLRVLWSLLVVLAAGPALGHVAHTERERIGLAGPHPDQAALETAFDAAAAEFDVPAAILKAVAFVESRWVHAGPTVDFGYGLMHLVDNQDAQTLHEAAKLTGLSPETLKTDPLANLRGGAALIARYVRETVGEPTALADYWPALKRFTGLRPDVQAIQAREYYRVLHAGASETNGLGMAVTLAPAGVELSQLPVDSRPRRTESEDYGPAIWNPADPSNYTTYRGAAIDRWVNHYVGVGTYAGAISWFKNPAANASAHFVIRKSDGEMTQMVRIAHRAWHCGTWNYRSIGIEHEATPSNPWPTSASSPMLINSAACCRYFCDLYGIPKTRTYIVGHNETPNSYTSCPGALPWSVYMSLVTSGAPQPDACCCTGGSAAPAGMTTAADGTTNVAEWCIRDAQTLDVARLVVQDNLTIHGEGQLIVRPDALIEVGGHLNVYQPDGLSAGGQPFRVILTGGDTVIFSARDIRLHDLEIAGRAMLRLQAGAVLRVHNLTVSGALQVAPGNRIEVTGELRTTDKGLIEPPAHARPGGGWIIGSLPGDQP